MEANTANDVSKAGEEADEVTSKLSTLMKYLSEAKGSIGTLANVWIESSKNMATGLGGTESVLKGIGSVLPQAFAAEKLIEFAAKSIDASAKIGELSEKIGVTAEDLSVLNHAAETNGLSMDKLGDSFGDLDESMRKALGGDGKSLDAFKSLGISVEELRTRSPRDLMLEIANGLDGISDPAERAAAAQGILGSSSDNLLKTLKTVSGEGFAKMADEADKMGLIVSGPAADAARQFQANWSQLSGSLMGAVNTIVTALLPAVNAVIGAFAESGNSGWMAWLNPIRLIEQAIKGVSGIIVGVVGLITALGTQMKMVAKDVGDFTAAVWKGEWSKAGDIAGGANARRSAQWDKDIDNLVHREEGIFLPGTGQVEAANRQATAPPKTTTPEVPHAAAVDDGRAERAKQMLEAAEKQVDALKQQQTVTGAINDAERIRIEHDNKITNIQQDIHQKIEEANRTLNKADASKLKTAYETILALQTAKVDTETQKAYDDLAKKAQDRADALGKSADTSEREQKVVARSLELEALRGDKIKSVADAHRVAVLEREKAEDDYQKKLDDSKKKAEDAAKGLTPPAGIFDLSGWSTYLQSVSAITRTNTAERKTAELQHNAAILAINKQEKEDEMKARQALHYRADLEIEAENRRSLLQIGTDAALAQAAQIEKHITAELAAQVKLEAATKRYADAIGGAISTAIEDALKGENFEDVLKSLVTGFQNAWKGALDEVVKGFMTNIGLIAAGQAPLKDGKPDPDYKPSTTKTWAARAFEIGAGALAVGMAGYQAGMSGEGGRTAGTLSGAVSGMAMGATYGAAAFNVAGAVVGAVIGAVIGAVGAYIGEQQRQADYKYGIPTIDRTGNVTMEGNKNLSPGEMQSWITKIGETYRAFWNGYVNVLLKLPGSSIPTPAGIDGKFQDNPSGHYLEHLQQWVEGTLPDKIAEQFQASMKSAFVNAGVLSQGFDKFWQETMNMDPKRALQFWTDLAEGLAAFSNATQTRGNIEAANGDWANTKFLSDGTTRRQGDSDFTTTLRTQTQGIFDVARQMVNLTGPEKVAAWKQLGASVQQVMGSLTDYLNRVGEAMRNARETIDNAKLERKLEVLGQQTDAEGNVKQEAKTAQIDLLMEEFNKVVDQMKNAKSLGLDPERLNALLQQAIGLQDRMYQIDPKDPRLGDRVGSLDMLDAIVQQSLKDLGDDAKAAVDKLMGEIEPFKQWLLGATDIDIRGALSQVTDSFPGFAQAIDELARKLGVAANSIGTTSSSTATTGGSTSTSTMSTQQSGHAQLHVQTDSEGGDETDNVVSLSDYIRDAELRQEKLVQQLMERVLSERESIAAVLAKESANGTPVNVTVNVNGTNVGVQELQANVTRAAMDGVVAAIRNNPTIIEHPFALGA